METADTAQQTPPTVGRTKPDPIRLTAMLAWLVGLAICIGCVVSSPMLLSNDGPQAAFTTFADMHLDDPSLIYQHQFSPGLGLTGRGFYAIYAPLMTLFSARTALLIFQGILMVLLAVGGALVARARHGVLNPTLLAAMTLPFAWPVFMGFYAYCVGTALGLYIFAYVLRVPQPNPLQRIVLFVLLLLQVLAHPMAALVTLGLVLLIFSMRGMSEGSAGLRRQWPWMALFSAPVAIVFLALSTAWSSASTITYAEKTTWLPFQEWLATIPRIVVPGSTVLGWFILALSLGGAIQGALYARKSANADERAWAIGTLGLFAFALCGPAHLSGWQFFASRFLWLPVLLGLISWRIPSGRGGLAAAAMTSLVGLGIVWNGHSTQKTLQSACADAITGLENKVPRTRYQLPIVLDKLCGLPEAPEEAAVPYCSPMLHYGALFAERHGGTFPFPFTGPPVAHFHTAKPSFGVPIPPLSLWRVSRTDAEMVNPAARRDIVDQLLVFGMHYENVLVIGSTKPDLDQLDERGYVADFARGTFFNGHFDGCKVDLVFAPLPTDRGAAVVAGVGEHPLWKAAFSKDKDRIRATLKTLCGNIWVQARWLESNVICQGTDAQGKFQISAKHGNPTVLECVR